jgi:hypothetical protein
LDFIELSLLEISIICTCPDNLPDAGIIDEPTVNHHVGHSSKQRLNASSSFVSRCKNLSKMLLSTSEHVKLTLHGSGDPECDVSGNRIGRNYD